MKKTYECRLVKKAELAKGIFDYTVEAPEIASDAKCGQFLHIDCGASVFLRRPISICDAGDGMVRFIFQVKGEGTEALSKRAEGDMINIMGPLGHGFEINEKKYSDPVIIGGGIGAFPLYKLCRKLKGEAVTFLGFRNKELVVMEDEFNEVSKLSIVGTDDGSYGYNGYVINALKGYIQNNRCDVIYSCGPTPLLKAVKQLAEEKNIDCQISLEQRMGCGIGACLVCACDTVHSGTDKRMRVCKNGPVFDAKEVVL